MNMPLKKKYTRGFDGYKNGSYKSRTGNTHQRKKTIWALIEEAAKKRRGNK